MISLNIMEAGTVQSSMVRHRTEGGWAPPSATDASVSKA